MKSSYFLLCSALIIALSQPLFAQTTPVDGLRHKTPDIYALTNVKIVVSPEKTIERGTIVVRNGRIAEVLSDSVVPADAYPINGKGMTVYPGFIEPFSDYGMPKPQLPQGPMIDEPHPTIERKGALSWNGANHAERVATMIFTPDESRAEELRSQGFCIAQTADLDGIFRGNSCSVSLGEGIPNNLILAGATYQMVSFEKGSSHQDYPSSLMGAIALIRQAFYDAQWYESAQATYAGNPRIQRPEINDALAALEPALDHKQEIVFDCSDELNLLRAKKIGDEFGLSLILKGGGYEYRRLDAVKNLNDTLIIPIDFPPAPDVSTPESESEVPFAELKRWDAAPSNPAQLAGAHIPFAFTSHGIKDIKDFLANIRKAMLHGLTEKQALAALTTVPAGICGIEKIAGTIEPGKLADLIVTSGPIFAEKTTLYTVWIDGRPYPVNPEPEIEPRGKWNLVITQSDSKRPGSSINIPFPVDISGEQNAPEGTIGAGAKQTKLRSFTVNNHDISFDFTGDSLDRTGVVRLSGKMTGDSASGFGALGDGETIYWSATRSEKFTPKPDTSPKAPQMRAPMFPTVYPDIAFGVPKTPDQPKWVAITNARIWTSASAGIIDSGTILFGDGKIKAVGRKITVPADALVIDGQGKEVTAGIVDEHSHIAISDDVNEGAESVSAEVRIGDVINSDDIYTYWQLAGGTTISHCLHGSANPIGGQCQVIKHRWGALPEDMKMKEAPGTIKFALGENVKQSNWGDNYNTRYPQTRMGVEEILRDEFQSAREYEQKWNDWKKHPSRDSLPPRRDLKLDAIVEILNGDRFIHVHSYVAPEILMLMRLAEEYGFRIGTFTHVLEGYKVAPRIEKRRRDGVNVCRLVGL